MECDIVNNTRELVRTTVKFVIIIVVLGILYEILPDLPGVRDIPFPGRLRAGEAGRSIVAFVALIVVLQYGRTVSQPIKGLTKSPKIAEFFKNVIYLIATVVAYNIFKDIAKAYMPNYMWIYSIVFILVGMVLAIRILRNLLGSVDTITDAIVGGHED